MKKIFILLTLIFISLHSFCQIDNADVLKKKMHLRKSRVYKIIGYSFLATGSAFFIKGNQLAKAQRREFGNNCFLCLDGLGEQIVGASFLILSIPPLIIGSNQRHKARAIRLSNQQTSILKQNNFLTITQPCIKLTFGF